MPVALTRAVSPSIVDCELTHIAREPIDFEIACEQHEAYEKALAEAGCKVHRVPPEPDMPDAVFVEDMATVLDELAIITRPGAPSRRAERDSVANSLARWRTVERLEAPGTLDGGDVVVSGRTIYVGLSSRTNTVGIRQLEEISAPLGYRVVRVPVRNCLHLKSAVTCVGDETFLINPAWTDAGVFSDCRLIEVDANEQFGANAVRAGRFVIYPSVFPGTRARLESAGFSLLTVPASELAKAEGGVSCCSLIFDARSAVR